jgi:hypothetical protein
VPAVTDRAVRNDPRGFTRDVATPTKSTSVAMRSPAPEVPLLTLQRTAGNAAVVDMLDGGMKPPRVRRAPDDQTIHRFYCLWDDAGPDGEFTDQKTGQKHGYKWIPEARDESLYKDSDKVTGWKVRNLYEKIPGAKKAAAPAKAAAAGPSLSAEHGGGAHETSGGSALKLGKKNKGSEDPAATAEGTLGVVPKPPRKPEEETPLEANLTVGKATLVDEALEAYGKKWKATGTGTLKLGTSGFSGEGEASATSSSEKDPSKSKVTIDGVEIAKKASASSEKTSVKGSVGGDGFSGERSHTSSGAAESTTETYSTGASATQSSASDVSTDKQTAKLSGSGLSASSASTHTSHTASSSLDAGNLLGDKTSAKGTATAALGASSRSTSGSVGSSSPASTTPGTPTPSGPVEASVEHSRGYDLAKGSLEASTGYKNGSVDASAKGTASVSAGASAKGSAKGSIDTASGEGSLAVSAEAFAGVTAETSATATLKVNDKELGKFKGTLGLSWGIGGSLSGGFSFKGGSISLHGSGKASLGVGTSFSYSVEVDTVQIVTAVADKALSAVGDAIFGDFDIDLSGI